MFIDSMTLAEARDKLRELVEHGHVCPVCNQLAKVYTRGIYATMARDLIAMARHGGWDEMGWVEVGPAIGRTSPDLVKLRYWGLVEKMEGERPDGSRRIGRWRLTPEGLAWIRGQTTVPSHARIYNERLLNLVARKQVSIEDVLGKKFDYRALMEGV